MKEYNYLQTLYMSFYSRSLYRDVAKNWEAGVVLYLLILLAICWFAVILKIVPGLGSKIDVEMTRYESQIPHLMIKNGQISTPEDHPYIIKEPDTQQIIGIIDTSKSYQNLQDIPKYVSIVVTRDSIIYMNKPDSVKIQKIPTTLNYDFHFQKVKQYLVNFLSWWGWMIFFPVLLLLSLVYRLVQAVIYAVLGKIFSALMSVPLAYSKILKIAIVAVTPAIIVSTVLSLLAISLPMEHVGYFILSMAYLIFGIGANKDVKAG